MSLTYDFDMFSVIPTEIFNDPKLEGFMSEVGINQNAPANKVALFRDPKTAEALANAPEQFKSYMLECGFGLNTYDSGAGPNCYPAEDDSARTQIMQKMDENFAKFDLKDQLDGEFKLTDFIEYLSEATPVDVAPIAETPIADMQPPEVPVAEMPVNEFGAAKPTEHFAAQNDVDALTDQLDSAFSDALHVDEIEMKTPSNIAQTPDTHMAEAVAKSMVLEEAATLAAGEEAAKEDPKTPFWKKPFALKRKEKPAQPVTDLAPAADAEKAVAPDADQAAIASMMEAETPAAKTPFWKKPIGLRAKKDAVTPSAPAELPVEQAASVAKTPLWKKPMTLRAGAGAVAVLALGYVVLP